MVLESLYMNTSQKAFWIPQNVFFVCLQQKNHASRHHAFSAIWEHLELRHSYEGFCFYSSSVRRERP